GLHAPRFGLVGGLLGRPRARSPGRASVLKLPKRRARAALEAGHHHAWRHPAAAAGLEPTLGRVDPRLLRATAQGAWWEVLEREGVTLLVTREYEHLVLALRVV